MLYFETVNLSPHKDWIVFIHGAGGSIKTWGYQIPALQKRYNLLLIDLRDHGSSKNIEPDHENYRFSIITADIKEVLDHLNIQKAHFVTLSFGSVLMQDFSMRYGHVVDKIVIAGGIFKGNYAIKTFVSLAKVFNLFLSYPKMYSLFSYLLMPKKRNQKARRIYQRQAQKLTQREYMKWVGLYGEFFRLLKQFYYQVLQNPTLVVMGGEDFIFLQGAKTFVKRQPHASMQTLHKVGHICNIENPDDFNKLVIDFFGVSESSSQKPGSTVPSLSS